LDSGSPSGIITDHATGGAVTLAGRRRNRVPSMDAIVGARFTHGGTDLLPILPQNASLKWLQFFRSGSYVAGVNSRCNFWSAPRT
jgi:hypothetical protein